MDMMVAIIAVAVMALGYFAGTQHYLDARADKLAKGGTLDRRNAKEIRELADKVDPNRYYPSI
ncbi:hypothetical protein [Bifidobacterium sp. SO4]|uniref:hypothetical protein n=1 Tax=Bifidobacterium sp. SO4 TaxID=2809030 RepID=UPI001BDBE4C2|nr:hypothetical protein [Bifidobacterium sp. SO4]MBT1171253.1 hypothetical protein [Bifidobacterium sp. SO4]